MVKSLARLEARVVDQTRARLPAEVNSQIVRHLSVRALARELDVSTWTILRWVKRGQFPRPVYLTDTSPPRWPLRTVEAFLLKRSTKRHRPVHQGAVRKQMEEEDD
jgi:predicted DNA-binding transcriptional regulator AlpA